MKLYLSRWVCSDVAANFKRLEEEAADAAEAGAGLAVFPELLLQGYTRDVPPDQARDAFRTASAAHPETVFVFGSIVEQHRNRITVWRDGHELTHYDKVHLFAPNGEPDLWVPGERYVALQLDGWTLGLLNCNDIRFPEQARALRLAARCDLLVVPAWWPWRRDSIWATLLRARAYENAVWTVGCCVAASEHYSERFAGAGNYVFDPTGEPIQTRDDHMYELDRSVSKQVVVDPLISHIPVKQMEIVDRRE